MLATKLSSLSECLLIFGKFRSEQLLTSVTIVLSKKIKRELGRWFSQKRVSSTSLRPQVQIPRAYTPNQLQWHAHAVLVLQVDPRSSLVAGSFSVRDSKNKGVG